jgi:hypothetical protein
MRAVGCVVVIVAIVVIAYVMGFGQGEKACISDCKRDWCVAPEVDPEEPCDQAKLKLCRDACVGKAPPAK